MNLWRFFLLLVPFALSCSEKSEQKEEKDKQIVTSDGPNSGASDSGMSSSNDSVLTSQDQILNGIDPSIQDIDGEQKTILENNVVKTSENNISTFSIDVDTGSYTQARQFLQSHALPPVDTIRIEEFINYFDIPYPEPSDEQPFSVSVDSAKSPWSPTKQLVRIGLKGKEVPIGDKPASNLVFLIDASGSMSQGLPLVKYGIQQMVEKLTENDRVAIVLYAGQAGLALPSTDGSSKDKILAAVDALNSGGGTNGAAGIELAYQTAIANKIEGGINRVILATDGDFNIGPASESELDALIKEKASSGVMLSVLGVNMRGQSSQRMESLANIGNGNYYYLDRREEARRVLVQEMTGTLQTIAKDVKIQVDFKTDVVDSFRLIGYENRVLENDDFSDDTKDAGEIGAGHTVTAFYELTLKENMADKEALSIKVRYKQPEGSDSTEMLVTKGITEVSEQASTDFKFLAAVVAFSSKLRNSSHIPDFTYKQIIDLAGGLDNPELSEKRRECIELMESARVLTSAKSSQ